METLKKLKIWLIEWKYFRQLKIVLFALLFSTIFYIVSIEYLFPLINKLYSLLDKVLFYLFFACSFISVIIYLIIFHIKYLSEHLASLVSIFLILVMVFLSQYISCHRLTFWFVVLCIVVFVFLWISLLHIRDICDVMEKPKKIIKQYSPIQIDSPIDNIVDDKLGRKEFVRHTVDFFVDIPKGKRGLKVVLSGGWGEGKTSCLNIILKKLFKKGAHHIIEVNPWFNDTKQQLLDAILEQINLFISTNKPYENIDYEIKNLLKLVKIDTNFFSLSCAEEDKDIKNVVSDIGRVLDNYDKRIIVSFDDLDRLPKDKILSVLQVTEMFSQYTNIIFILSMDRYKVEQVLCEVGDACSKNGDIRNVSQYKNYIEKIASIIIKLPKPRAYFVRKYLVETLNLTLRHLNKEELSKVDVDFYLSLERFNSLRDVKRVLNAFYISFSEVKNEVSVTDYFNLTVLYCFYPDIYQKVYKDRYIWFGNILQSGNNEELKETVKKYFYNILDSYSEEKEILKDLINHITPALYIASGLKDDLEIHKEAKSYLLKEDLIERYFSVYFNHNFDEDRIPDAFLDEKINEFASLGSGKLDKLISSFLVVDEVEGKWIDLFDYLIINYTAKYKKIYKSIIIETVKLMGLFERKYIHVFATVIQKIDRLIYLIFENNTKHILVFKEEVLFSISSVSLRMQYFMLNNFFKSVVNNNHLREIQDKLNNSITRNKEASVESFSLLSTHYLYSYIRNWHCNEELPLEDPLVKERVAEFSPFVFGNINYFWQFIGNDLKNNLEIVISRTSFMLKDHENNINYFLTLWGKEAICNFILEKSKENNAPKNIIELKSLLDEYIKREESKKKEAAAEEDDDDTM